MASAWAITQISRLLPLDEDSLKQILEYTYTLSKPQAAEHLKEILGDSSQALEFISMFNSRRDVPKDTGTIIEASEVPRRLPKKKKSPLHNLPPPRRPEDFGNISGAYLKRDEDNYMAGTSHPQKEIASTSSPAFGQQPNARKLPISVSSQSAHSPHRKPPPSAAGSLISDLPDVKASSRNSFPKAKINVAGGTLMHGALIILNDVDSAIRELEIQTNPTLSKSTVDISKRRCNCQATRHALLAAAPNCLNCGKIVCVKEGLGPCTFCSHPILGLEEIHSMVRFLKEERGRERMDVNNASHRRAEVSKTPHPYVGTTPLVSNDPDTNNKLEAAQQHKARLLDYQAQNARRTRIIDEAADFETPISGQSIWSNPVERAKQLKRQQKILREQEWNAKPEYEKRRTVISVDLVGGKVLKRMGQVERPQAKSDQSDDEEAEMEEVVREQMGGAGSRGTFSRNPLMGSLIRPIWRGVEEGDAGKGKTVNRGSGVGGDGDRQKHTWRRVQDENDDNEAWILDGGVYGGREDERRLGDEEHAQG